MNCGRNGSLGAEGKCGCTFTDCGRWGKCCSCVQYHRSLGEIPGCFFSAEAEKSGNRSVEYFRRNISRR